MQPTLNRTSNGDVVITEHISARNCYLKRYIYSGMIHLIKHDLPLLIVISLIDDDLSDQ